MRKRLKILFLLSAVFAANALQSAYYSPPLCIVGCGYFDAGSNHSGVVPQFEYRPNKYYFNIIRPMAIVIAPELRSVFVGVGLGAELYSSEHLVITPSFAPGLYYKGSGKDLGYPLEFRSCFEVAYEWDCGVRIGFQYYHISNASLSNRNPGANALVMIFALPLACW